MEDIPTLLQKILQTKATEVAALKAQRIKIGLPLTVEECAKFDRRFEISLRDSTKIPIIAEIKRKSPSSGRIVDPCIDAVLVAKKYEVSNAACISVLTDQQYFGGSMDDLDNIASAITIPILRKDFIVDEVQILEAKEHGASAVLLIVAVLGDRTSHFVRLCNLAGIESLVEVHTAKELDIALKTGCRIIGVNSRCLHTFVTDLSVAEAIVQRIPEVTINFYICIIAPMQTFLRVCESGVKTPEDGNRMLQKGFDVLLIGEALMRTPDVSDFLASLKRGG